MSQSQVLMTTLKQVNDLRNCDGAFWEKFNAIVSEPRPAINIIEPRSRRKRIALPINEDSSSWTKYDKVNPVVVDYRYIRVWRTSYGLIDPDTGLSVKSSSIVSQLRCEHKCKAEELKRGRGRPCLMCGSFSKSSCNNCLRCVRAQFGDPLMQ